MAKAKIPLTAGIRTLREADVTFTARPYRHHEKDVAAGAARELGVSEHLVVKTLVMEDDQHRPLVVLMHGDKQVSTKALARVIGVRSVTQCSPELAQKHTGYLIGGISPFGVRKPLPIYVESSVLSLPKVLINAGKRGLLVEISAEDLRRVLKPIPVSVARQELEKNR